MDTEAPQQRDVRWVRRYANWLCLLGVILVISGLFYFFRLSTEYAGKEVKPRGPLIARAAHGTVTIIGSGLVAVGLGQLLAYIFGVRQRAGWLLRNGDKGLYVLAALYLAGHVVTLLSNLQAGLWHQTWLLFLVQLRPIAQALVLVALGLVLRRVLPIVEESRTLI